MGLLARRVGWQEASGWRIYSGAFAGVEEIGAGLGGAAWREEQAPARGGVGSWRCRGGQVAVQRWRGMPVGGGNRSGGGLRSSGEAGA